MPAAAQCRGSGLSAEAAGSVPGPGRRAAVQCRPGAAGSVPGRRAQCWGGGPVPCRWARCRGPAAGSLAVPRFIAGPGRRARSRLGSVPGRRAQCRGGGLLFSAEAAGSVPGWWARCQGSGLRLGAGAAGRGSMPGRRVQCRGSVQGRRAQCRGGGLSAGA